MPKRSTRGVNRKIGARVRLLREQAGLSIDDVAWEIGIGKPHLSRIERGERAASYDVLFALAAKLGVITADLVTLEKTPRTRLLEATRGLNDEKVEALLRFLERES